MKTMQPMPKLSKFSILDFYSGTSTGPAMVTIELRPGRWVSVMYNRTSRRWSDLTMRNPAVTFRETCEDMPFDRVLEALSRAGDA